jgi:hypothetical protein
MKSALKKITHVNLMRVCGVLSTNTATEADDNRDMWTDLQTFFKDKNLTKDNFYETILDYIHHDLYKVKIVGNVDAVNQADIAKQGKLVELRTIAMLAYVCDLNGDDRYEVFRMPTEIKNRIKYTGDIGLTYADNGDPYIFLPDTDCIIVDHKTGKIHSFSIKNSIGNGCSSNLYSNRDKWPEMDCIINGGTFNLVMITDSNFWAPGNMIGLINPYIKILQDQFKWYCLTNNMGGERDKFIIRYGSKTRLPEQFSKLFNRFSTNNKFKEKEFIIPNIPNMLKINEKIDDLFD